MYYPRVYCRQLSKVLLSFLYDYQTTSQMMLAHSAVEIIDESCGVARSKADAKCHSSVGSTQLEMNCGC